MGIYTLKFKHQVIGYIFPYLYNTGMFDNAINILISFVTDGTYFSALSHFIVDCLCDAHV